MRILITGGTGSLGSVLTKEWTGRGHEITVLSRNPHKQAALAKELPNTTRFILTDICNYSDVSRACEEQDWCIHTAALKQVDVGEYHPTEYARVNVQGTITVVNAWRDTHKDNNTKKMLFIGSDKGCHSLNTYGACKKIGEAVFRKYGGSVVRYGNIVSSRGSFYQLWKINADKHGIIQVRTPEPTRFLLTFKDAVDIIEDAMRLVEGGDEGIYVPHNLKAFSLHEVARWFAKHYNCEVEYEPLLPYEKKNERLVAEGEIPVPVSPILSKIVPGWGQDISKFQSNRATQITAEKVAEILHWK